MKAAMECNNNVLKLKLLKKHLVQSDKTDLAPSAPHPVLDLFTNFNWVEVLLALQLPLFFLSLASH